MVIGKPVLKDTNEFFLISEHNCFNFKKQFNEKPLEIEGMGEIITLLKCPLANISVLVQVNGKVAEKHF